MNRPTFGSGVHRLLFAPINEDLVATARTIIHSSLTEYLGDLIIVEDVDVFFDESKLVIEILYIIRRDQSKKKDRFERKLQ